MIAVPLITSLDVAKLSNSDFNLSVSLAYTGGGAITHLQVSFQDSGTTLMTPLGQIPATPSPESSLVYHAVVSRPEFAESPSLVFLVSAVNREGFVSHEVMKTHDHGMLTRTKLCPLYMTMASLNVLQVGEGQSLIICEVQYWLSDG